MRVTDGVLMQNRESRESRESRERRERRERREWREWRVESRPAVEAPSGEQRGVAESPVSSVPTVGRFLCLKRW